MQPSLCLRSPTLLLICGALIAAAGCATTTPRTNTRSPAPAIQAQAQQTRQIAADVDAHATAIDRATPPKLAPAITPHTDALHADAAALSDHVAPALTAASKDAGQVAAERDQWHQAYTDEVAREKSALQSELRKVSIGAGLVGLVLIGLGIWLGISGNIKWAASVGAGGVAALIVAGIIWKIAPYIGWIIWLTVFALILISMLFVLHKVGLDKITGAWETLVGAIESVGDDAIKVKTAVAGAMKDKSAKVKADFGTLIAKAKAKL